MDIVNYAELERHHDGYPGEFINEQDIVPGLRFFLLEGPDKNIKEWFEVIELNWNWKTHSYKVAIWDEKRERIHYMSKRNIYIYGRI